jgi:hypothetical protein
MKKLLILLILAAAVGAGWYFYDPYIKPHVDGMIAKYGESDSDDSGTAAGGSATPDSAGGGDKAPAKPAKGSKAKAGGGTVASTGVGAAPKPQPAPAPLSEIDQLLQAKYPLPEIIPLMQIVDNWNNVPQNAYPTEVAVKEQIAFKITGVGSSVVVPGTLVRPTYLSGDTLTVASLANLAMRTKVNVDATDFKDRVQNRYNEFVINTTERVKQQREKARKVLQEQPDAVAAAMSTKWDTGDDPRFDPVKRSLERGDVPSVKPEEATGFRWAGKQNIRGKLKGEYETVIVSFDVVTIFGVFPVEWMALLDNGGVKGWVDPITHEMSSMVN